MEKIFFETKLAALDGGLIEGTAWPFGSPDRVGDVIEKGAFAGASLPLPMLFGHDPNDPVGTWTEAEEDEEGLKVKGSLLIDDVARAREVHALVKAGAVKGLSVGFQTRKASPRKGGGRTITKLDLWEVSLVTFGMHPGARVTSAKSVIRALQLAEALNRAAAQLRG
ncbi:HK97 family phage prohead protease [Martelella mediterranea]|uniref:Phage prohead protease, HK97 family n=1 Tax=Martelella mediterranea DSM 17316 TaxID=1122214 RepID=A0A1U9YYN6_9HYPH|nr:HK97 family phage prohead protease [Martelella mediterranea]AQZ50538.1 phage prohead protease, HK97 family [Martelella mediterranea DSM 17316]